jgi:hypothetical protein
MAAEVRTLITKSAATLERLAFRDGEIAAAWPEQCQMHKLMFLSFTRSVVSSSKLSAFLKNCRNLMYVRVDQINGAGSLFALAESCPALVYLHYGYAKTMPHISRSGLKAVLVACKELHTVNFTSVAGFTNAHVATVVQHCRKLRALRIELGEGNIDEECVAILAPRLPQLRHLAIKNLRCTTVAPVWLLAEHCHSLKSLDLEASVLPDDAEAATVALFTSLPYLDELNASSAEWLTDTVLAAIGEHCHHLRILDVTCTFDFTEKGVAAIAKGCSELEVVYTYSDGLLSNELAQHVWQAFRPSLKFVEGIRHWTRWNNFDLDV